MRTTLSYAVVLLCCSGLLCTELNVQDSESLTGNTWQLVSVTYTDGYTEKVPESEVYTIRFEGDSLFARDDCWTCSGVYKVRNRETGELEIEVACPEEVCGRDQFIVYGSALLRVDRFGIDERTLRLFLTSNDGSKKTRRPMVLNHELVTG